jgi:hypothetical protein
LTDTPLGSVVVMTARLPAGSAGSPVLNLKGEVVGVVVDTSEDGDNASFALSSEAFRTFALGSERVYLSALEASPAGEGATSGAAAGEWTSVVTTENGDRYLVDHARTRPTPEGTLLATVRVEFAQVRRMGGRDYNRNEQSEEYDCGQKRWRLRQSSFFRDDVMVDQRTSNGEPEWLPVDPETIAGALLDAVCAP